MSIIAARDLCKIYGSGENSVRALDEITVSIEDGEFVSIIGTSGSGKSTLLNMLGGLDRPTSGEVLYSGKKIFEMNDEELTVFRRRNIGFVFQNYNLVPVLNVYENIVLPIELDGAEIDKSYVDTIIKTLGLDKKLNSMPNQLSGGQQQRTAIGRAIVKNPDILLCDEPTGALDYKTSKEILKLIETVNQKYGNTVVMVTHNDAIKDMADRVVRIRDGMIRKNYLNDHKVSAQELDW